MVDPVVSLQKVTKSYSRAGTEVSVLQICRSTFPAGTFLAIMGPSGSGKSTLLNVMAGIDRPTSGSVVVAGNQAGRLVGRRDEAGARATSGHVFQTYNPIPVLTAAENVELPLALTHLTRRESAPTM